jgi:ribosomal protein L37AE/L43A
MLHTEMYETLSKGLFSLIVKYMDKINDELWICEICKEEATERITRHFGDDIYFCDECYYEYED